MFTYIACGDVIVNKSHWSFVAMVLFVNELAKTKMQENY